MPIDVARAAAAVKTELGSLLEDGSVGSPEDDGTSIVVVVEAPDSDGEGTTGVVVPGAGGAPGVSDDAAGPEGALPGPAGGRGA